MKKPDRPKVKLELTPVDKFIELVGWGVLLFMWLYTILNYSELPNIIPVHFNAAGEIDGYGTKSRIWELLIVCSAIYIGMGILSKFPQIYNYPTQITKENAAEHYTIASKICRYLNLIILLLLSYLVIKTIHLA